MGRNEDLGALLTRIRAERIATGYVPRNKDEIDADIRQMRDEWEEHQLRIERLQEECRRAREARAATDLPGQTTDVARMR